MPAISVCIVFLASARLVRECAQLSTQSKNAKPNNTCYVRHDSHANAVAFAVSRKLPWAATSQTHVGCMFVTVTHTHGPT